MSSSVPAAEREGERITSLVIGAKPLVKGNVCAADVVQPPSLSNCSCLWTQPKCAQIGTTSQHSPKDDIDFRRYCIDGARRRRSDDVTATGALQSGDFWSEAVVAGGGRISVSKYLIRNATSLSRKFHATSLSKPFHAARTVYNRKTRNGTINERIRKVLDASSPENLSPSGRPVVSNMSQKPTDNRSTAASAAVNVDRTLPDVVQSGAECAPCVVGDNGTASKAVIRHRVENVVGQLDLLLDELKTVAVDMRELIGRIDHVTEQVGDGLLVPNSLETNQSSACFDGSACFPSRGGMPGDVNVASRQVPLKPECHVTMGDNAVKSLTVTTYCSSTKTISCDVKNSNGSRMMDGRTTVATSPTSQRFGSETSSQEAVLAKEISSLRASQQVATSGECCDNFARIGSDRNNNNSCSCNGGSNNGNSAIIERTTEQDVTSLRQYANCDTLQNYAPGGRQELKMTSLCETSTRSSSVFAKRTLFASRLGFRDALFRVATSDTTRMDSATGTPDPAQSSIGMVMTSSSQSRRYRRRLMATEPSNAASCKLNTVMTSSSHTDLGIGAVAASATSGDTPTTSGSDESNYDGIYERDLDEILETGVRCQRRKQCCNADAQHVGTVDRNLTSCRNRKQTSVEGGRCSSPDSGSGTDCWSTDDDADDDNDDGDLTDAMVTAQQWNDWYRHGSPDGSTRSSGGTWSSGDEPGNSPRSYSPTSTAYSVALCADYNNPFTFHRLNRLFAVRRVRWRPEITIIEP
jgi:hypothetical protein